MHNKSEISRKYLFFLLLYGTLSFFIFCLILFPTEKLALRALYLVSERLNFNFTTQGLNVIFPGQLELVKVKINQKQDVPGRGPFLTIDRIKIRPKFSQLFLKKICLLYTLDIYQGKLEGSVNFDLFHPKNLQDLHCLVRDIQLNEIKQIQELYNISLTGKLSGEANLQLVQNNLLNGTGNYHFIVTPGEAKILSFPGFIFQCIKGDGNLNLGKVKIRSVQIQGDELQAQINGDLRLNQTISRSYLNTKVHINLTQALKDKLGALAGFLPGQNKDEIRLNIRGNLNKLSFMPM